MDDLGIEVGMVGSGSWAVVSWPHLVDKVFEHPHVEGCMVVADHC